MTVQEIIVAALRKIGVVRINDDPASDYLDIGLVALNMMIHGWEAFGVDLNHSDLALSDDMTITDAYHEGVVYLLANRLADEFDTDLPNQKFVRDWWAKIRANYTASFESTLPPAITLQDGPAQSTASSVSVTFGGTAYVQNLLDLPVDTQLRLIGNSGDGLINRLLTFKSENEYERANTSWVDHNDRHQVSVGYHYKNISDESIHQAYEVKTSVAPIGPSPTDMRTRLSVGTDADYVPVAWEAVSQTRFRGDGDYYLWIDDDINALRVMPDTNQSGFLTFSDRIKFGYDEPSGRAVIRGESGKAVAIYTGGRVEGEWSMIADANDKGIRFGGSVEFSERSRSQLSSLTAAAAQDQMFMLNDGSRADYVAGGVVNLVSSGTDRMPVYSDGVDWRYL